MMLAVYVLSAVFAAEPHVVREGESVESLAEKQGSSAFAAEIRKLNGLKGRDALRVGDIVLLPEAAGSKQRPGEVLAVRGEVTVAAAGSPAHVATRGEPLLPGTLLCTGIDGYATARLARDDITGGHDDVSLLPDTCITIELSSYGAGVRRSQVRMERGSLNVREAGTRGDVTIVTPSGVTTGEDGGFRVTMEKDAARTEALTAAVAVLGGGVEVKLAARQGSRVRTGERPSAPVNLLEPGLPVLPEPGASLRRPDFGWSTVERALGYRLEIGSDEAFSELFFSADSPTTSFQPELLLLPIRRGGVYWRVASFDRTGFLGIWSDPRSLGVPSDLP